MLTIKMADSQYSSGLNNILENICLFNPTSHQSIKLCKSQLITGIADLLQIYVRYTLDQNKRQILFNFRIINMTPFAIDDISIDFERNLSMVAMPYPETSKHIHIPQLSTRQAYEWNCLFVLHNYFET